MTKTSRKKNRQKLERNFDASFATKLALREKQIQQSYRPIIGIHKWFARRPGTIFRSLLLAEFGTDQLEANYWRPNKFEGIIADPFMGGGTPIFEANRLGFHVVGTDINPMAYWVVRQALAKLDTEELKKLAQIVAEDVEKEIGELYRTRCKKCGNTADVKYFLWVKTSPCPSCACINDLFPGHLLAEAERHPMHVVVCAACGHLNEYGHQPSIADPARCAACKKPVCLDGAAKRQHVVCRECGMRYPYLEKAQGTPLEHRLWAIEYHCSTCKATHEGRFFKKPDAADLEHVVQAKEMLSSKTQLPIPEDAIPKGDETDRLHRWGYKYYWQMFNQRQLLGLGLLLQRLMRVKDVECRHALLTVFSDCLRYQNLLCRYDTYALKCQDIFSVHGFPVGLVQCENNLLGILGVGSGSFRHFVEKYLRAKEYCVRPFETLHEGRKKSMIPIPGENIGAEIVGRFPSGHRKQAYIRAIPAWEMSMPKESLDGVFTDPPYFDNVQYAELMDFCFAWLRIGLKNERPEFERITTRTKDELTGNETLGRDLVHFTGGLSTVFQHYAQALKLDAPFVFTYHHNEPKAYLPLIVAVLDAGLTCTATLPAAAEMNASLHISGTGSSVLDSVFVCRRSEEVPKKKQVFLSHGIGRDLEVALEDDAAKMEIAGLQVSEGDLRCLLAGHIARIAINILASRWDINYSLGQRMKLAEEQLCNVSNQISFRAISSRILRKNLATRHPHATTV